MKKKESSFQLVIKIVILVAVMVGAIGVIANVVGDVNDTIDGFGGGQGSATPTTATTISPSECKAHEYDKNGICTKCGTVCAHTDRAEAENGNTYCSACGKLYALKAPVLAINDYTVFWEAVSDAELYIVYVNDAVYKTDKLAYECVPGIAGDFVIRVQAVKGTIISEESNACTISYYSVNYDENDHGEIKFFPGSDLVPPLDALFIVRGGSYYTAYIVPDKGYVLPSEIYVTMGGVLLSSGYVYDNTTGAFTIDNVTGDLYITYDATTGVPGKPVLTLNGKVLSWNAVPGADNYRIRVYSIETVEPFDEYYPVTTTSFDLSNVPFKEEATYSVSVWADNEYGFGEASAVEYVYVATDEVPTLLSAPEIAFSSEGVIVWDAVDGASFYTVYCEGSETSGSVRMTYDQRFDLTTYASDLLQFGDAPYAIYVKASGEGYADSAASNRLTYTPSDSVKMKLAAPVIKLI